MDISLENIRQLAYDAHRGISFSPEKRAQQIIDEYTAELKADIESIGENETYVAQYTEHLKSWLSAKSRCLSPMITGPAKFPVTRNEKANNTERKRYQEFRDWRANRLKAIERNRLQNRSEDEKSNDAFEINRKVILDAASTIFDIDNGINRYSARPLFVKCIVRVVQTVAKNGDVNRLNRCLDLIKQLNEDPRAKKPLIASNNSIWKLAEEAEANRERMVDKKNMPSREISFVGGVIIINTEIDRIQIKHDQKPDQSVINELKRGYNWSPSQKVWQRKLTDNALYATSRITGVEYKKLKS